MLMIVPIDHVYEHFLNIHNDVYDYCSVGIACIQAVIALYYCMIIYIS